MRKGISLLLVLLLVLATLVGCGPKEVDTSQQDPVEEPGQDEGVDTSEGIEESITVQVEEGWVEYYEEAAARVKEVYPDATIEFITTGSFDHLDVLDATDVTNEDVADLFAIPADRIYGLSQNEALAALDSKAMANNLGGFSNFDQGLGGNFNIDGEYLAFPMNIETLINFVNTANAEENDVDLSDSIEFTELDYEDILVPVFDAWFGVSFANAANIELLGMDDSGELYSDMVKDFGELEAEKQAVFTALYDYWKSHKDAKTSLFDEDAAWGYMDAAFSTDGSNSIRLEGPWSTGNLSELAGDGEDLDILAINQVTVDGNPLAHWKGGWGLAINSRAEENEDKMLLAQAMIEEIVNPEYAVDFFKATGKILENVTAAEYLDSDLPEIDKKVIEAVLESYEAAPARPLFTEWGEVWDTWKHAILSWNAVNPSSAEEAYKELQASFTAMMENF